MPKEYLCIIIALALFFVLWFQKPKKLIEGFSVNGENCDYCHSGISNPSCNSGDPRDMQLNQCDVMNPQFSQFSADEEGIVQKQSHLDGTIPPQPESESYAYNVIEKQAKKIRSLRNDLKKMAMKLDDMGGGTYRRRLSNKNYKVRPFMSHAYENSLNLNDDDFSTKTLSTIKFLSHTRGSKFFGDEIHFPTELCGHYCTTSDPNAQFHEQLDLIRPVKPTDYINKNK